MRTVVAFDPGGTTGVAIYTDEGTFPLHNRSHDIQIGQLKERVDIWDLLTRIHYAQGTLVQVVIEKFTYQRRDKVDLTPVEIIGVIKLWCDIQGVPWVEQTPAQAKKFWTNEKIKKVNLWDTKQNHAMDAVRHLLYYLTIKERNYYWVNQLRPTNE